MAATFEHAYGALLGLAYGDAIGFPALFHRFQDSAIPRRRHDYLWRTNQKLDAKHIVTLTLPFTHRTPASTLEPCPTDDTEFALLTLQGLIAGPAAPTQESLLSPWLDWVLPAADEVRSGIPERAAIENLERGERPPVTGNDNPLHYADSAVPRAVPIGLYCAGNPVAAAELAKMEAQITQAEDGIYAAQAMASAVAVLAGGGALAAAMDAARACFPDNAWIAHGDDIARACLQEAGSPEDLALLLTEKLINTVYSFGNAAPETLPAALVLVEACSDDLVRACAAANMIAKSADSLPAMVGALCGVINGPAAVPTAWHAALASVRGLCLPFLAGVEVAASARQLAARMVEQP